MKHLNPPVPPQRPSRSNDSWLRRNGLRPFVSVLNCSLLACTLFASLGCRGLPQPGLEDSPALSYSGEVTLAGSQTVEVEIPKGSRNLIVWTPLPHVYDLSQDLVEWEVQSDLPSRTRLVVDALGNRYARTAATVSGQRSFTSTLSFLVRRREVRADLAGSRPHSAEERNRWDRYLTASPPESSDPVQTAREVADRGLSSEAIVADLRARGIPARLVHGASSDQRLTWFEFHCPGLGWIPGDPRNSTEAALIGKLPADRITLRYLEAIPPSSFNEATEFSGNGDAQIDGKPASARSSYRVTPRTPADSVPTSQPGSPQS